MRKGFVVVVLIILALLALGGHLWLTRPIMGGGSFSELKQSFCSALRGEMRGYGCGRGGCSHTCIFPYRDAGKPCQTSKDCSGKCVVAKPFILEFLGIGRQPDIAPDALEVCKQGQGMVFDCTGQNFEAACQQWPISNCQRIWEYDKGFVRALDGECN